MTLRSSIVGFEPSRRRWRAWAALEPVLAGMDTAQLRAELDGADQQRRDDLLAALVRVASGDAEAQLVVVGCLWPGMAARARRYARPHGRDDALSLLVAELVADLASGRHLDVIEFVASRLLEAPTGRLRRALRRERDWADRSDHRTDPEDTPGEDHTDALSAALILRLAVNAGALSERDAWLIHAVDIDGHSLRWAARRLRISYSAAVKRRQRAKPAWRAWWHSDRDREPSRESSRDSSRDAREVLRRAS